MHSFIRHSSDTNNGRTVCTSATSHLGFVLVRNHLMFLQQNLDIALVHDSNLFMTRSCAPQELPRVVAREKESWLHDIDLCQVQRRR